MIFFRQFLKTEIALTILLTALSILALVTLLRPDFYYSHDGILHTVRLAMFDQALRNGQIVPRWSQQLAFGLGSPVLMFYGVLPNYLGSLFHSLGINYQNSTKAVLGTSFILSGLFFYFFAREKFGKLASFVGALFYVWAPYRFIDVYVRGAVPESFAFIFPPLIFLSGEKLIERSNKWWLALNAISVCGIIMSHNVLALVFVGIYTVYLLCRMVKTRSFFADNWLSLIIGVGLSSFFLWPALLLQNQIHLETLSVGSYYLKNFATLKQVFYSPWGWGPLGSTTPMSVQLGLGQWLGIATFGLFILKKWRSISGDKKMMAIFFSLTLATSIFLMTRFSETIWKAVTPLQIVLYPWRFMSLAIFAAAILAAMAVSLFPKKYFAALLLIVLLYANRNYTQVSVRIDNPDSHYSSYKGTTDVQGEFLPKQVDLSMIKNCGSLSCHFEADPSVMEIFTSSGVIKISNWVSLLSVLVLFLILVKDKVLKHKEKVPRNQ